MFDTSLIAMILIPALVYWLSRKPGDRKDVLRDYIVPHGVEVRSCATHWGVPAGVSRFDSTLWTEVMCHPDFVERNVPEVWFRWNPSDARRRARQRLAATTAAGVLPIRKQA